MTQPDPGLSPETFERLIARAMQIDEQGKERIDAVRAREIAADLGITGAAWDTAVREWTEARGQVLVTEEPGPSLDFKRMLGAAMIGGAAGGAMGLASVASSGNDIAVGGALIASAGILALRESVRHSLWQAHAGLAAWWIAAGPAIMISVNGVNEDILAYTIFSWAGCAGALTLFDLVRRRVTTPANTAASRV